MEGGQSEAKSFPIDLWKETRTFGVKERHGLRVTETYMEGGRRGFVKEVTDSFLLSLIFRRRGGGYQDNWVEDTEDGRR